MTAQAKKVTARMRQEATQLCAQYIALILDFNNIIDIRKRKANFQIFSCRIIGDSCILIIANNAEECKNYIKCCIGGTDWVQADTNEWQEPYTKTTCWAGISYSRTGKLNIALYRLNETMQHTTGQTIKEYVKQVLKDS